MRGAVGLVGGSCILITWSKSSQRLSERILPLSFFVRLQRSPDRFNPLFFVLDVGRLQKYGAFLRVQGENERFLLLSFGFDVDDVAKENASEGLEALVVLAAEIAQRLGREDEVPAGPALHDPALLVHEPFLEDDTGGDARLSHHPAGLPSE